MIKNKPFFMIAIVLLLISVLVYLYFDLTLTGENALGLIYLPIVLVPAFIAGFIFLILSLIWKRK